VGVILGEMTGFEGFDLQIGVRGPPNRGFPLSPQGEMGVDPVYGLFLVFEAGRGVPKQGCFWGFGIWSSEPGYGGSKSVFWGPLKQGCFWGPKRWFGGVQTGGLEASKPGLEGSRRGLHTV
jgi:hypothetical protein